MGNEVTDRSRLIQIAGAIAMHTGFVSPCADDHSRATPRSVIKQAEDQDTRLKDWAYELRQIADRMSASTTSPLTPEGLDAIIDAIPTSWLDSLLTGPDAVLHGKGGTWGCPDIERLLSAIKERQRAAASELMAVTPSAKCRVGSAPDEFAHMSIPWCATHTQFISACQRAKATAPSSQLQDDIDKFWFAVHNSWDIEPREYFEKEARENGFDSPLAMAVHYMWKRETKAPSYTVNCHKCGAVVELFPSVPSSLQSTARDYQRRLYDECITAGWDSSQQNTFAEEIAHLHEELSEAFRAYRLHKDFAIRQGENGKPEGVPIEFADVIIGLFYNAELHGFDLFAAIEEKHQFNLTRDYNAEGRQLHPVSAELSTEDKQGDDR